MQPDMFEKDYDAISMLLGEAGRKFFGIELAYTQAGHLILFLVTLVCAFAQDSGNPLTNLPTEIRGALKGGLLVTYGINTALTAISIPTALSKNLPVLFWAPKVLLLGGLAFDELNNAPEKPKSGKKKK